MNMAKKPTKPKKIGRAMRRSGILFVFVVFPVSVAAALLVLFFLDIAAMYAFPSVFSFLYRLPRARGIPFRISGHWWLGRARRIAIGWSNRGLSRCSTARLRLEGVHTEADWKLRHYPEAPVPQLRDSMRHSPLNDSRRKRNTGLVASGHRRVEPRRAYCARSVSRL